MKIYCKTCGKEIDTELYNMREYAYKKAGRMYCSYKCMRKHEKEAKIKVVRKYERFL